MPKTQEVALSNETFERQGFKIHKLPLANWPVTLKAWKASLKPGMKMRCTFRHYWNKPTQATENFKPAPPDGEMCEIQEVRATYIIYSTATCKRSWLHVPKASELKATSAGFELYFPIETNRPYPENPNHLSGALMSRYEYVL